MQEGTTIGVLTVRVSGQVKLIKNIQVAQTVKKKNMINYMKELIEKSCLNNITK